MHKRAQVEYFEGLLAKHGANHKALDWNSRESQAERYEILREIFLHGRKGANLSLLDVGSGLGDLYGYLKRTGLLAGNRISYCGYDISPKLVEAARQKYPEARFEVRDIAEDLTVPRFDYIFCCGIFNIRTLPKEEQLDFVKSMLRRMFELADCGVAVNFLSEGALLVSDPAEINSGRYFVYKPEELAAFSRQLTSQFILRHDYNPGDFTLYLLK